MCDSERGLWISHVLDAMGWDVTNTLCAHTMSHKHGMTWYAVADGGHARMEGIHILSMWTPTMGMPYLHHSTCLSRPCLSWEMGRPSGHGYSSRQGPGNALRRMDFCDFRHQNIDGFGSVMGGAITCTQPLRSQPQHANARSTFADSNNLSFDAAASRE